VIFFFPGVHEGRRHTRKLLVPRVGARMGAVLHLHVHWVSPNHGLTVSKAPCYIKLKRDVVSVWLILFFQVELQDS
jgi:hypothetical protein